MRFHNRSSDFPFRSHDGASPFALGANRTEKDTHILIHSTSDVDSYREIWMEKIKFGRRADKMQQMRKWTFALSSELAHYSNINLKTFPSNCFPPSLSCRRFFSSAPRSALGASRWKSNKRTGKHSIFNSFGSRARGR